MVALSFSPPPTHASLSHTLFNCKINTHQTNGTHTQHSLSYVTMAGIRYIYSIYIYLFRDTYIVKNEKQERKRAYTGKDLVSRSSAISSSPYAIFLPLPPSSPPLSLFPTYKNHLRILIHIWDMPPHRVDAYIQKVYHLFVCIGRVLGLHTISIYIYTIYDYTSLTLLRCRRASAYCWKGGGE